MISGFEADLRRIMRDGHRPVAFVGSGFSTNKPDWSKFVHNLANHVNHPEGILALKNPVAKADLNTLLAIADESVEKLGSEGRLKTFMGLQFDIKNTIAPSVFSALVHAPFAFYLTTNYDTNIEDAYYEHRGVKLEVVRSDEPEKALHLIADNTPFVYKIHGCAKLGGPYVIGSADYHKFVFGRPAVKSVMHAVFATHPVVFMGYGHRDPHISIYLGYQRQILERGGPQHFTFIERGSTDFDAERLYRRLYGISCIEVDAWPVVENILNQLSFLQIRDEYVKVRREQAVRFHDFVTKHHVESAWGALLYAWASSDIGRVDASLKLWTAVQDFRNLRDHLKSHPSLHLTFCLVAGQMLKRKGRLDEAQAAFELLEGLARSGTGLIRPTQAMAFRYAGIFWILKKDLERARSLFNEARRVIGSDFPEEALDQRKWDAVLLGEENHSAAANALLNIAIEADQQGYRKNGAWCRFSAVDQIFHGGVINSPIDQESELASAIEAFEQLDHTRGLADCHCLLAEIWRKKGRPGDGVAERLELARAMAIVAGHDRIRDKCADLLKPPTPTAIE